MNSLVFCSTILLSLASRFSVSAVACDFCPGGETNSDYCTQLLSLARDGKLYEKQEECDFNIPILNKRCGCDSIVSPHTPCDPCGASFDIDNHVTTTISNPEGQFTVSKSEYSCIEMLYSARNGGVEESNCVDLSIPDNGSACGQCVETTECKIDEALCLTNQKIVASNGKNFPGPSVLWSTALACDDLIEKAREGILFSMRGCKSFIESIDAAFRPRSFGIEDLVDLSTCGLQCDYDENSSLIQGRGEFGGDASSDSPSQQESEMPSGLPSAVKGEKDMSISSPSKKKQRDGNKNVSY